MPRKPIKIENKVEYLQVLDENGKLDKQLEPEISDSDLRKLYKTMLATRMLDERCLHMQRQGRIGTYGPCKGQEATPLAVAYLLEKSDWLIPTYRELSAYLWRGWPIGTYMLWWGGHEAGSRVPEGVNDLPICVPIASQCQYGMGIAWGLKMRGKGEIAAVFCGDGGTSQGDFHEAMNFASVYQVPMIMVVQNNQWAISLPRERQTGSQTIAQKAIAYGLDAIQIDGNDILSGIVAFKEAAERARNGDGPMLIEAVTYRLSVHTTADDPKKYRSEEEVKQWEKKDPLPRFRQYLIDKELLDDRIENEIKQQIKEELDEGVKYYESYEMDRLAMFKYMYDKPTPELKKQQAEAEAYLRGDEPDEEPASEMLEPQKS